MDGITEADGKKLNTNFAVLVDAAQIFSTLGLDLGKCFAPLAKPGVPSFSGRNASWVRDLHKKLKNDPSFITSPDSAEYAILEFLLKWFLIEKHLDKLVDTTKSADAASEERQVVIAQFKDAFPDIMAHLSAPVIRYAEKPRPAAAAAPKLNTSFFFTHPAGGESDGPEDEEQSTEEEAEVETPPPVATKSKKKAAKAAPAPAADGPLAAKVASMMEPSPAQNTRSRRGKARAR